MKSNITVEDYIKKHNRWEKGFTALREIFISSSLQETIKWGGPVYTINGKNLVGMAGFKSYLAIWFFQGALLKDAKKK